MTPAERIAAALAAIGLDPGEPESSYLDGYRNVWFGVKWDIAEDRHGDFNLYRKGNWQLQVSSLPLAVAIVADAEGIDVGTVVLCPKGERVVLDRTGDTDRLVRQEPLHYHCTWVNPFTGGGCGIYECDTMHYTYLTPGKRPEHRSHRGEPSAWVDVDSDGAHDGGPGGRPRLEAKAEGVRLALSYISDQTRHADSK